jgi:16S rRNA (uracil1498-N3)-methyltransferase
VLPRFLADSIDSAAATAHLGAEETRHLTHVLRLGAGDEVAVFDGTGHEFHARVDRIVRDGADLTIVASIAPAPEPSVQLTLAQAVLKGDKMDDVVRDATMMGVSSIVPLITDHTVAHVRVGPPPDRWTRIAIASAKQCRRAVLPRIHPVVRFREWLNTDHSSLQILLTEPSAAVAEARQSSVRAKPERSPSATLGVGPEGGWSAAEVTAAVDAGFETLTLGRRTLRADAVAIVAIGVLQHEWGDL